MNEPTIKVYKDTPLEEIIRQLEELGLIEHPEPVVIEYRWYYNSKGQITGSCSNPKDAEIYGFTGDYIVVDEKIYNDISKYTVVNGKPMIKKQDMGIRSPLQKADYGFRVIKNNAGILVEDNEFTNTVTEHYAYKNS